MKSRHLDSNRGYKIIPTMNGLARNR